MSITDKVSYLKGLADGLGLDENNKQDKLISAIIDVLGEFSETVNGLDESVNDLFDQIDAIDEDLSLLEEDVYDDEYDEDDDDEMMDSDFYEVACPSCGDEIYLDEEMLEAGGIECPNCGTELEFDVSCGCGCENHDHSEEN